MDIVLLGLESWEHQLWKTDRFNIHFNEYLDTYTIGLCEATSYQHPFVNKLNLYREQGIPCGTGYADHNKPFYVKPIQSLYGLGTGSYRSTKSHEIPQGFLWVEEFKGKTHRSIDFVINNGIIEWSQVVYAHKKGDLFIMWEVSQEEYKPATDFVKKYFPFHNGAINLEMIGKKVLEVHCRPSTQFLDLFNMDDMPGYIISNHFNWNTSNWPRRVVKEPCYSWVYYLNKDSIVDSVEILDMEGVKSIQKTYKKNLPCSFVNQKVGEYRVAFINTESVSKRPRIRVFSKKLQDEVAILE